MSERVGSQTVLAKFCIASQTFHGLVRPRFLSSLSMKTPPIRSSISE